MNGRLVKLMIHGVTGECIVLRVPEHIVLWQCYSLHKLCPYAGIRVLGPFPSERDSEWFWQSDKYNSEEAWSC